MNTVNPELIRRIYGSFAAIEHRFMRDGFFANLSHSEIILYFFLVLVANRSGISWYGYDRILQITGLTLDEYVKARNELIDKELLTFDARFFQVLTLPEKVKSKKVQPRPLEQLLKNIGRSAS